MNKLNEIRARHERDYPYRNWLERVVECDREAVQQHLDDRAYLLDHLRKLEVRIAELPRYTPDNDWGAMLTVDDGDYVNYDELAAIFKKKKP